MYQRFKAGLFNPSEVARFQNDKKMMTILFFLLLVLISAVPGIVAIQRGSGGLDYSDRTLIRQAFVDHDIPFSIVNYQLGRTSGAAADYAIDVTSALQAVFTEELASLSETNPLDTYTKIIFDPTGVYFQQSMVRISLFSYSEYPELQNLDFSGAATDDSDFWAVIFPIIDEQIANYASVTMATEIISLILYEIFILVFLSFTVAIFQMMSLSGYLKFGKVWQVMVYVMVPFVMGQLFDELFALGFLSYIGIAITIFHANRLTQVIMQKKE